MGRASNCWVCEHPKSIHEHHTPSTYCATKFCTCPRYVRPTWWRRLYSWIVLP